MTLTRKKNKNNKKIKTRKQRGGSDSPYTDFVNQLNTGTEKGKKPPTSIIPIDKDIVDFFNTKMSWQINETSTFYDIYNITPDASNGTIKKRYVKLALILHPDKNSDYDLNTWTTVDEIYKILLDDEKRIIYNELLNPPRTEAEEIKRKRERNKRKREREEAERLEEERLKREKLEREEKERKEDEEIKERKREEEERIREEAERERKREEEERIREEAERERIREEAERIREEAERERIREEAERQRLEQEEAERQRLEQERIRAEEERKEELKKRIDETKAKNDKRLEEKRLQREQFEKDRLERERLEKERLEKELLSYNFSNTTIQKKIIGKPIVIEGLRIYNTANDPDIKSVFNPQFGLKGGKKTYNKRNRLKKTKKIKR